MMSRCGSGDLACYSPKDKEHPSCSTVETQLEATLQRRWERGRQDGSAGKAAAAKSDDWGSVSRTYVVEGET